MDTSKRFNLLFPEWQGYAAHQDVYYGAYHFCRHVSPGLEFAEVPVPDSEELKEEGNIIGRTSLLNLLDNAAKIVSAGNPEQIFMVGGTCACEIVPVSYLTKKYDSDLAVFWFDAHADLNTPDTSPSHRLHGMPLRSLLGDGDSKILARISRKLEPSQVALVGVRDLDDAEMSYVQKFRIPMFRPNDAAGAAELVDFAKTVGFTKAYIHFDLDALDPEEFPHVLIPTPDGLKISTAIACLQYIRRNFSVVGCSIVEYCPKDAGGKMELKSLVVDGLGIEV